MDHLKNIDSRIKELESYLSKVPVVTAELEELQIARRVVARLSGVESSEGAPTQRNFTFGGAIGARPMTTQDYFVRVLSSSTDPWMTANDLRALAVTLKGADIPMSTVSPTLSVMRNRGIILRNGLLVALTQRVTSSTSPTGPQDSSVGWGSQNKALPDTPEQSP